jgi:hypothetical protein
MSKAYTDTISGTIRSDRESTAARSASAWLSLAAAPTFAAMALLTGAFGSAPAGILCAAELHGSPLGGMTAMYALMSAFHAAPWLKLIGSRRS